jgi:penicillin-binding protein 1A
VRRLSRFALIVLLGGVGMGMCFAALVPGTRTLFASSRFSSRIADHLSTLSQRTLVYDNAGNQMGIFAADDRERVKLNEVPKSLVNAVIATEDRTFWKNPGVDLQSTVRALFENVRSGQVRQGGSTITQQLIKNRILTPKRDLNRKLREVILAYRFDSQFSKKEILEEYLNTVYFGQGSYGVKTAAERFFQVKLGQLTVGQSALLAGLIQNPDGYNPFAHPERSAARRVEVLKRMEQEHYVTKVEAYLAMGEALPKVLPTAEHRPDNYFLAEVEQRLFDDPRLGVTQQERQNKVLRGGLRVYTTYDPRLQYIAQATVNNTLAQAQPRDPDITASLVVMDPQTGAVRAMVGGPGFEKNQYNVVTHYQSNDNSGRQPGSTFKVVALASAIENGYSPHDTVNGSSNCVVQFPDYPPQTKPLKNAEPGGGTLTLRRATEESVNCAYLRLGASLGLGKVAEMAKRLGICAGATVTRSRCPYWQLEKSDNNNGRGPVKVPVMVYGSGGGQIPLDMATVFNTLAADGVRHDPIFITKVVGPDGKTVFENKTTGNRAIDSQVARTVTDLLQGVITNGTGTRADIRRPAAGKTGTTDDQADAWFDGYTPQMTAVVWMGHLSNKQPMGRVGQFGSVFGGTWPALIWRDFMGAALADQPPAEFPAPDKSLWSSGHYISDSGRSRFSGGGSGSTTTTTAVPGPAITLPGVTSTTKPSTSSSTNVPSPTSGPPASGGGTQAPGP